MKHSRSILIAFLFVLQILSAQKLQSPNQKLQMEFSLQSDGTPIYSLTYKGKVVIKPSKLGFQLKNDAKSLLNDFTILDTKTSRFDETWKPVWGEVNSIRNHYNELAVTINKNVTDRQMLIRFHQNGLFLYPKW